MRITGGQARGRQIVCPEGKDIRPTASKVRQALFNILANRIHDARFLDLFAGTGLMGLEALSRGARSLISVEESRQMVKAIETSLKTIGFEGEVIAGDVRQVLPILEPRAFDIIFADPPYKSPLGQTVLKLVDKHDLLAEDALFVIEHSREEKFPQEITLCLADCRIYGQTALSFFRRMPG